VIFQNVYFSQNETKMQIKENIYFFKFFWARQGLTLLLRISIKDGKSIVRSSIEKTVG